MGTTLTRLPLRLCAMLVLLASCSATRHDTQDSRNHQSVDAAYAHARRQGVEAGVDAMRNDLQLQGTFGYIRPHVPVRTPPNVMRVWIPAFEDGERNLVQGHWVHVVISDEGWTVGQPLAPTATPLPRTPHARTSRPSAGGQR
jgi:hypothetical protein